MPLAVKTATQTAQKPAAAKESTTKPVQSLAEGVRERAYDRVIAAKQTGEIGKTKDEPKKNSAKVVPFSGGGGQAWMQATAGMQESIFESAGEKGRKGSASSRVRSAAEKATAAQKELESVIQQYRGTRDSAGGYSFPYEGGVAAYNRALLKLYQTTSNYQQAAKEWDTLTAPENYHQAVTGWQSELEQVKDELGRASAALTEAQWRYNNGVGNIAPEYAQRESEEDRRWRETITAERDAAQKKVDELTEREKALKEDIDGVKWAGRFRKATQDADFDEFAARGAAMKNPSMEEANAGAWSKKPVNVVTFARDNKDKIALAGDDNSYFAYTFMTDDEAKIYNYYLGKGETKVAEEYLDYLREDLNRRWGEEQGKNVRGIENPVGRTAATGLYGVVSGLDNFLGGAKQAFSSERIPTSPTQYGSAYIKEDLKDTGPKIFGRSLGQIGYGATEMAGEMAPAMALGTVNPLLGVAARSTSTYGNTYNQALAQGYDEGQARSYAMVRGAIDGTLQYVIGGISKLSGGATGNLASRVVENIDHAALRVAADVGIHGMAQGTRDYLLAVLDPAMRNWLLDEDNDVSLISEDAAYAFLSGFFTAGAMRLPGAIKAEVGRWKYNNAYKKYQAQESSPVSEDGTDYFEGIADETELKARYKKLARENHPDMGGDTAVMQEINRQYSIRLARFKGETAGAQAAAEAQAPEIKALPQPAAQEQATAAGNVDPLIQTIREQGKKVSSQTAMEGQKTATDGVAVHTGQNIRLTNADIDEYLTVGKNKSIRDAKSAAVEWGETVILSTPGETQDFIGDAIRGVAGQTTKAYGKVGTEMAGEIQAVSGSDIDVTGWYLELVPDDLHHAFKQHEKAKQEGNISLTEQDFLNIPDYIDSYDDILEFRTFKSGDREVVLGKKINGYSVIVELLSGKRKSLHFKNMWGLDTQTYESRYGKSTASHPDRSSVSANDPTEVYHGTSSIDSIPQTAPDVNTETGKDMAAPTSQPVDPLIADIRAKGARQAETQGQTASQPIDPLIADIRAKGAEQTTEQGDKLEIFGKDGTDLMGKSAGEAELSEPGEPVQIGTVDFTDKKTVLEQIDFAQKETADLDYEVNYSVTTDGKVWRVRGLSGTVNPSAIPSSRIGSYSYHNHPRAKTWGSFSAADVRLFFSSGEYFSKASDHLYEYIMERTQETVAADPEMVYHRFKEIETTIVGKMKWDRLIDPDLDGYHEIMKILSQELRFHYERKSRSK